MRRVLRAMTARTYLVFFDKFVGLDLLNLENFLFCWIAHVKYNFDKEGKKKRKRNFFFQLAYTRNVQLQFTRLATFDVFTPPRCEKKKKKKNYSSPSSSKGLKAHYRQPIKSRSAFTSKSSLPKITFSSTLVAVLGFSSLSFFSAGYKNDRLFKVKRNRDEMVHCNQLALRK